MGQQHGRVGSDQGQVGVKVKPDAIKLTQRLRVEQAFRQAGRRGLTRDQVEADLGLSHQTATARVRELLLDGVVTETQLRRRTRSGRYAAVVMLTDRSDLGATAVAVSLFDQEVP